MQQATIVNQQIIVKSENPKSPEVIQVVQGLREQFDIPVSNLKGVTTQYTFETPDLFIGISIRTTYLLEGDGQTTKQISITQPYYVPPN